MILKYLFVERVHPGQFCVDGGVSEGQEIKVEVLLPLIGIQL